MKMRGTRTAAATCPVPGCGLHFENLGAAFSHLSAAHIGQCPACDERHGRDAETALALCAAAIRQVCAHCSQLYLAGDAKGHYEREHDVSI